jgi:hypothetical protein
MSSHRPIMIDKRLTLSPVQVRWLAIAGAGLLALVLYLTTLQVIPNGSQHAYGTDVGEIQNALPRWGTLHFPGYPLYSLSGSAFVTVLRLIGLSPAVGASLYSALWGAASVALLAALALAYEVPPGAAVVTALLYGLATSAWVDGSVAEVHTMTMGLMLASLLVAIDFGRTGRRSSLLWLALLSSQAVLHQRAMVFVGPALLLLVLSQWPTIRRNLIPALGLALAGALVYLYLPLRDWMGADWTFNAPGTWSGFWSLVLDTKTERIVNVPQTLAATDSRIQSILGILANDWPLLLIAVGLLGLLLAGRRKRWIEAVALILIALPFLVLSLVIWEGRVSDALLALNLPVYAMAALGLALVTATLYDHSRVMGTVAVVGWLVVAGYLYLDHRPEVLAITRDPGALKVIAQAERIDLTTSQRPITLMAFWGRDYWALAYAQGYQDSLAGLNLVDHNANLGAILDDPTERLLTLSSGFYWRPLSSWEEEFGPLHLSMAAPGIVEISRTPPTLPESAVTSTGESLGNGVTVRATDLAWHTPEELWLTVYWQAEAAGLADQSVAVHLVAKDPPNGPDDILAQADQSHPVEGWYPISRWQKGEVVRDVYLLKVPPEADPVAVRVSTYQVLDDGQFSDSEWLSLPLPPRPTATTVSQ